MKDPGEALQEARRRAEAARAGQQASSAEERFDSSVDRARRLARWAIIAPDPADMASTRRFGKPITWFKQLLLRLLSQYLDQVNAQQSRFNADIAAHVVALEQRVAELEAERRP